MKEKHTIANGWAAIFPDQKRRLKWKSHTKRTWFPGTSRNEALSPGRKERMAFIFRASYDAFLLAAHIYPGSINKACFVQRMNEDGFLLCILLKLESYGSLPSPPPPIGFQEPNAQIWLASNPPSSASVILTSRDIQQVWRFFITKAFLTVTEQIKVLCSKSRKHNMRPFFTP